VIALGAAPLITAAVTRERVTLTLVAALLGLTLLAFGNDNATTTASLAGIALSVLSAAGYALTTLINKNTPDPTGTALITFAIGATTLLPAALIEGAVPAPESLPAIAYLGLVHTALAYALFYTALKTLRPTTATLLALTEPLVATVLGLTVFHESLNPAGTAGAALLLGALTARTLRE
jgi:DME family drug/metabolite transporter